MTPDELRTAAEQVVWWHGGMDLGHSVVTQSHWGNVPAVSTLPRLDLPADLRGLTVLDIGAWDGFFSFECERRGARHVTAVDSVCWQKQPAPPSATHMASPTGMDGFNLAREVLESSVDALTCDVYQLPHNWPWKYDMVLFLGVLYHLRHPLLAMEKVVQMVKPGGLLILESHVNLLGVDGPAMRFYPGAELNADPTNWWGPNPACIEAMLCDVGFTAVRLVSGQGETRVCFHARR